VFDALNISIKELGEHDPRDLTDDELSEGLVELHRLRASLEAIEAKLASTWDTRRGWAPDGAKSGAAWLARKTRASKQA
jgi:hypothetical protein